MNEHIISLDAVRRSPELGTESLYETARVVVARYATDSGALLRDHIDWKLASTDSPLSLQDPHIAGHEIEAFLKTQSEDMAAREPRELLELLRLHETGKTHFAPVRLFALCKAITESFPKPTVPHRT